MPFPPPPSALFREHVGYLWTLELVAPPAPQGMRSAWIDLTTYIDSTRDGPSKTGSVTIGNEGGHADVQLEKLLYQEHPGNLSDEHARFEEDGDSGKLYIEDLLTTVSSPHRHTGTYVNGFSINVKTQLHPGDTITFGTGPTFKVLRNVFVHA